MQANIIYRPLLPRNLLWSLTELSDSSLHSSEKFNRLYKFAEKAGRTIWLSMYFDDSSKRHLNSSMSTSILSQMCVDGNTSIFYVFSFNS